jgi:DNA repair protein RadC
MCSHLEKDGFFMCVKYLYETWHDLFMTKKFKQNISQISLVYKNKVRADDRPKITTSKDAYVLFRENWDDMTINLYEEFKVLLVDNSNRCMGIAKISQGGITSTTVDIRLIFALAMKARANGIILGHNHPSGNTRPSFSDIELTQKIMEAGKVLDVQVLDHLILGEDKYLSMADRGFSPF